MHGVSYFEVDLVVRESGLMEAAAVFTFGCEKVRGKKRAFYFTQI